MKKKLSEGRESKRQALLRKKKEGPAAFWTYVCLLYTSQSSNGHDFVRETPMSEDLLIRHCSPTPVSYTHLDVYKRQADGGAGIRPLRRRPDPGVVYG